MLGALFGQFDANLVLIENRLGVFISARGNRVQIEGPEEGVARARDVLKTMHQRLMKGEELDPGLLLQQGGAEMGDVADPVHGAGQAARRRLGQGDQFGETGRGHRPRPAAVGAAAAGGGRPP